MHFNFNIVRMQSIKYKYAECWAAVTGLCLRLRRNNESE